MIIGRTDQGAAIFENIKVQMAIPMELTIKPVSTERRINGNLVQAIEI
jgi:hypothetical protein